MSAFPDILVAGYGAFRAGRSDEIEALYRTLGEEGQRPHTMVIACCDSRSAPETIFNAPPGALFTHRNVANLVAPYIAGAEAGSGDTSMAAALEFAVQGLQVRDIVVLGHSKCGGVGAALNPEAQPLSADNHVGQWVSRMDRVRDRVLGDNQIPESAHQGALEQASVLASVANLARFPVVAEGVRAGRLALHGAWFDVAKAALWTADLEAGRFSPVPVP